MARKFQQAALEAMHTQDLLCRLRERIPAKGVLQPTVSPAAWFCPGLLGRVWSLCGKPILFESPVFGEPGKEGEGPTVWWFFVDL
jgi:hypothetical protein